MKAFTLLRTTSTASLLTRLPYSLADCNRTFEMHMAREFEEGSPT
jgi:hypothetical protein